MLVSGRGEEGAYRGGGMSRLRLKDKCVIDIQWHIKWRFFACAYDNVGGRQGKQQPNKCERQENWQNFKEVRKLLRHEQQIAAIYNQ